MTTNRMIPNPQLLRRAKKGEGYNSVYKNCFTNFGNTINGVARLEGRCWCSLTWMLWLFTGLACIAQTGAEHGLRAITRNRYSNHSYQYDVQLPRGVTAYMKAPPNPNHGLLIEVGGTTIQLWVNGSYDAGGYGSSSAVTLEDLSADKRRCAQGLSNLQESKRKLGGLDAMEYRFTCGDKVVEQIAAVRSFGDDRTAIIYEIGLNSSKADEVRANQLFQQLRIGFRQIAE